MKSFPLGKRRHEALPAEFDFGRVFEDFFKAPFKLGIGAIGLGTGTAVDIYEKNGKIVAKIEIPGAKPQDLKLSVDGDLLTISGDKKVEHEVKRDDYYQLERSYGRFQRTVRLPADVKAEEAKAVYKSGVLTVELPKSESRRTKDINIDIN